jgi:thioesterase domain-containing protein/acyl carrier protein
VKRVIVGPRTHSERLLADVWESVFKISPISVTDSFWDLGGHSMLAVKLMATIAHAFGKRIPLNTLFEAPTVAQLAKHIDADSRVQGRHTLVRIRAKGTKPPLYWIPGGAALGMFSLKHLVSVLGDDVPVYGLGSAFPNTIDDIERVEDRAAKYLSLIRRAQPHGPYFFVGYCAGGIIAFEMAQQLLRENESVGLLGMINCDLPGTPWGRVETMRFKAQRLRHQLREARKEGKGVVEYFRDRQKRIRTEQADRQLLMNAAELVKRDGFAATGERDYRVVLELTDKMLRSYQVRHYSGTVSLFVSDDPSFRGIDTSLDPRLAWMRVATRRDIYRCDGDHESVLKLPFALSLAEQILAALRAAWQDTAASQESRAST